jgi:hypothetical protein
MLRSALRAVANSPKRAVWMPRGFVPAGDVAALAKAERVRDNASLTELRAECERAGVRYHLSWDDTRIREELGVDLSAQIAGVPPPEVPAHWLRGPR